MLQWRYVTVAFVRRQFFNKTFAYVFIFIIKGTPFSDRCECPEGLTGPRCEITSVGFHGDGWALYPTVPSCEESFLSLRITPATSDGLIFYLGPLVHNELLNVQGIHFLSSLRNIRQKFCVEYKRVVSFCRFHVIGVDQRTSCPIDKLRLGHH